MSEVITLNPTIDQGVSLEEAIANRVFPADDLGIPLSIYIPSSYRRSDGRLNRVDHGVNNHHRYAPKKDLIHSSKMFEKMLRYCCQQVVPIDLHLGFNAWFDKPILPETQVRKFGALFLSIARYLPAEAVDTSGDVPAVKELADIERQLIWANNELRPQQGSKVQKEIIDYILKQDLNGVSESLILEFLTTPSDETRVKKGRELFKLAAEVAVEPVEQAYIDAWKGKLLPRHDIRTERNRKLDLTFGRAVPKNPTRFILRHVIKDQYALRRALSSLETSLEKRYAIA